MAHNFKEEIEVKVLHDKLSDKILKEYRAKNSKQSFKFIKDKNLFEDEIISSKAIVCDLSRLDIWLLSYDKPIFLFLPKGEKFIHKDIPTNIITFFSEVEELSLKEDESIKERREQFAEDIFGKSFTINGTVKKKIKEILNY